MDRVLTRERLQGMWAGPPVPWTGDDRFAEDAYRRDVAKCCAAGVPGVYTGGSTGEFYAMDLDEFQAVAAATIEVCRQSGTPVQIGCTSTYTGGAVRRARFAQRLGADAIQVALPFWFALSDDQVIGYFSALADACPDLPIVIYDRADRAKRSFDGDLCRRIVERAPIIGIKVDTSVGDGAQKVRDLSALMSVFVGETSLITYAPHGASGCYSSLVYMNPGLALRLHELCARADYDRARPIHDDFDRLIGTGLAPFREQGYVDTTYDRLMGMVAGFLGPEYHRVRDPYPSTSPDHVRELRAWMAEHTPALLRLD